MTSTYALKTMMLDKIKLYASPYYVNWIWPTHHCSIYHWPANALNLVMGLHWSFITLISLQQPYRLYANIAINNIPACIHGLKLKTPNAAI